MFSKQLRWNLIPLFVGLFALQTWAQTCPTNLGATINIASLPYNGVALTTCGAGNDITASNATICGSSSYYGGEDLVFTFTPTSSGNYLVNLTSTSSWIGMMLYNGCPFLGQGGSCVNNIQSSAGSKSMTVALTAGVTYYLVVDTWPSPNCIPSFDLSISAVASLANDECASATTLTSSVACSPTSGTNVGATQSIAPITCNSFTSSSSLDVWYKFVATATTHTVTVVGGSTFDAIIDVRSGACNGTNIGCADATTTGGTEVSIVSGLTIGATYYARVYGWAGGTGTFTICVTGAAAAAPANDDCANATTLTSNTSCVTTSGTNVAATQSIAPITCATFTSTSSLDVWYKFTAVATTHTVTVVGAGTFDAIIDVRSGACNGTNIGCADGTTAGGTETATVSGLTIGSTYFVRVYGWGGSTGTFTICVTHAAFNPCASTPTLTCGVSTTVSTNGAGAGWSPGSCGFTTGGQEAVYSFTPSVTGTHTLVITAASGGFGDYFYKAASGGCSATGWTCIGDANSPESNSFGPLTAGTTYYLLFDSEVSTAASQTFRVDCPAAGSAPACLASPTSPTNGQTVCPSPTQTLSWPVASGATSYDVYFGTSASPPFVGNTASTTFSASTPTNGTYFWQIRPVNSFGTASGCAVWSFTKTDVTPPTITCPANVSGNTGAGTCTAVLTYGAITANDNCTAPTITLQSGLASGSSFPLGVNVVVYRASDGTNTATCSFTVTVTDITPPTITCPANVTTNVNPVTACSATATYGAITASDPCGAPSITLQSGLTSGSTFPVGANVVVYRATDGSGNTATCSFTVTVIDNQLPNLTCPANIVKANDLGKCNAVVSFTTPVGTDNCAVTTTQQSGQASGTAFPVGVTTNLFRATDASGNTRTCSFTVTVNDTEKPKITCPNNISKSNDFSYCGANIPNLGPTAVSDNCNIGPLSNNSPVFFPIGTTAVTWTILDNHGNSATCQQTVTISDNEWPYITCPSTITQLTDEGNCNAVVNFAATATDNCAGTVIDYTADPLSTFEIGYTSITATATDAVGHFVSCNFLVQVKNRTEICNGVDDDCDGIVDDAEDWNQVIKTNVNSGGPSDLYGIGVDISGDWAVVGSTEKSGGTPVGAAYVMRRDAASPGGWKQVAKLTSPNTGGGDAFGVAVAVDSLGVIAVGAPEDDGAAPNAGAVFVYQNTHAAPNTWTLVKKVVAGDPNAADEFGRAVSLSLNRLLVGAALDDEKAVNAGAAYVFVQGQGGANNWGQVAKMMALDGAADDHLGSSVSIHDIRALVGAPGNDEKGQDAGAAYLFSRNEGGPNLWGQTAKLLGKTEQGAGDHLGASVAVSNQYALVGAPDNDLKGQDAGLVFAFSKNSGGNNKWKQWTYLSDYNASAGDHYGSAVSMDNEYAVVTADHDNPAGPNSGRGFVYLRLEDGWNQVDQISDAGGQTGDQFGTTAALSIRSIIIGVPHDKVGNDADQGSALIFEGICSDGPRSEGALVLSGEQLAVRCYPVPFADALTIEVDADADDVSIMVVNTLGQAVADVYRGAVHGVTNFTWQAGKNEPGMYFLRVAAAGKVETKAVLLERP